jgi:DinB superfamily
MNQPDPVQNPTGYVEMVLSYLGQDDPAKVQARTPELLGSLVRQGAERLRVRGAPGEWSALELVGHLTQSEVVASARYRWILAEDDPVLVPYNQELWVERLRANEDDPSELLDLFSTLRRVNLRLWERASAADRSRTGQHQERGAESYELVFRLIAGHDRLHYEQALRALQDPDR